MTFCFPDSRARRFPQLCISERKSSPRNRRGNPGKQGEFALRWPLQRIGGEDRPTAAGRITKEKIQVVAAATFTRIS